MICPKCGKLNEDGIVFCYQCGEFLSYKDEDVSVSKRAKRIEQEELRERRGVIRPNKRRKIRPLRIAVTVAVLAVMAVSAVLVVRLLSTKSLAKIPVFYLKNDMLTCENYNGGAEYILSETPAVDSLNYEQTGVKSGAFKLTNDYKYCYFLQSGSDSSGYTLMRADVGNSDISEQNGSLKKIDTGVVDFSFGRDGKKVLYKKVGVTSGVGKLYYFDGSKNYGIADNVYDYCADSDFNFLYYTKFTDGEISLYEVKLSKPEKSDKVLDGVSEIRIFGKSVAFIYGTENLQHISIKEYGKQSVEIGIGAKINIENVFDGCIYYSVSNDSGLTYSDFVADEYKESDETMEEPNPNDYGTVEEYIEATEEYYQKLTRDSIRAYMEEFPVNAMQYALFVYKNNQSSLVDSEISGIISYSGDGGSVLYVKPSTKSESFSISDYVYGDALKNEIESRYKKSGALYVYTSDSEIKPVTDVKKYSVIEDAAEADGVVYYISKKSVLNSFNVNSGDHNEISSDINKLLQVDGGSTIYAVYSYPAAGQSSESDYLNTVYRIKKGQIGTVADDIMNYEIIDGNNIIYVKGETTQNTGTLYLNNGKNTKIIDSSVYALRIVARSTDSIMYFKNYKEESGYAPKAELYWYKGGDSALVDNSVSSIVF